jgi:AraC-like DNA-binding protein
MPITSGYTAICAKTKFQLSENDILLIAPGELHELFAPPNGIRLILQFDSWLIRSIQGFNSVMPLLDNLHLITKENSPDIHPTLQHLMLDIRDEFVAKEALNGALIYAKIIELYVLLARKSMKAETLFPDIKIEKQKDYIDRFYKVFDYINEHYSEDISLDAIAEVAGFSKFHFSRLFKQFTEQSFYDYLNHKRIKEAEALLLKPSLSITEISMLSGYSSISTFNRVFKSFKECTPSEFKALYSRTDSYKGNSQFPTQ